MFLGFALMGIPYGVATTEGTGTYGKTKQRVKTSTHYVFSRSLPFRRNEIKKPIGITPFPTLNAQKAQSLA